VSLDGRVPPSDAVTPAGPVDPVEVPVVGPEVVDDLAALSLDGAANPPTRQELAKALFASEQPAVVRYAPDVGAVATVREGDQGWIRFLVVPRSQRGRGNGTALLLRAEADLDGTSVVTTGADAPYFLWPGVPTTDTAMCALLERHHYGREETNYNMDVDLHQLPDGPVDAHRPGTDERADIDAFVTTHWPHWRLEVLRAFDQGGLWIRRDAAGIAGFCAVDVNRARTVGPVASRPDLIGSGASAPLLLGTLRQLREQGYPGVEVLWVGPILPYARVGALIGATFFVYRKRR
jgi:hypothetical protein